MGKVQVAFLSLRTVFHEVHIPTLYLFTFPLRTITLWLECHQEEDSRLLHLLSVVCHPETRKFYLRLQTR